jgi:tRNA(Ile)-lysidine synthase
VTSMASEKKITVSIERRVCAFVRERQVLRHGERALLMLSGGADSMALLALAPLVGARLGLELRLAALHVDYATRGADSERDRLVVQRACAAVGVPLHVVRLSRKLSGANFQERARELRYGAAFELLRDQGLDVVVTAHNRDDQAETVLYRLAKYAAPSALLGMRPREEQVAHPLLCVDAAEVRAYCAARAIEYGEDATNAQPRYARNALRLEVLPALARINPRVAAGLAEAADLAAREQDLLEQLADEAWSRVTRREIPGAGDSGSGAAGTATFGSALSPAVDIAALAAEPPALRALCLRRLLRCAVAPPALIPRRVVVAVETLARTTAGSGRVALPGGYEVLREYGRLVVRRREPAHRCEPARLVPSAGVWRLAAAGTAATAASAGFCGRSFHAELLAGPHDVSAGGEGFLGLSAPPRAVLLRHPRRGDRFVPLGMSGETSVARYMAAAKVPRSARALAVVAEVDGRVAWLAPPAVERARTQAWVAESCRVTQSSACTLHVREEG